MNTPNVDRDDIPGYGYVPAVETATLTPECLDASRKSLGLSPRTRSHAEPAKDSLPIGRKDDGDKPLAAILYQDFPRALQAVIQVASFGARKYSRHNWLHVLEASTRYEDALHRHLLAAQIEPVDPDSGLSHKAHAAWNALAILELELREAEKRQQGPQERQEGL